MRSNESNEKIKLDKVYLHYDLKMSKRATRHAC